jgi:predicted TPR repeat methyltransferase
MLQLSLLALSLCAAGLASQTDPANRLFHDANEEYMKGNLERAKVFYQTAIRLDSSVSDFHCNLGAVLSDLSDLQASEMAYRTALELDGNHPSALFNLGMLLQDQGKFDDAVTMYRRLVSVEANNRDAWANLGSTLHAQSKLGAAASAYRKAINILRDEAKREELDPNQNNELLATLHENLGRALANMKQYSHAIDAFKVALKIDPERDISRHMLHSIKATMRENPLQATDDDDEEVLEGAPREYVRRLFDDYSSNFEQSLQALEYKAPNLITKAALRLDRQFHSVLDLGCGTGLSAEFLVGEMGIRTLIGVDLSPGMLSVAEEKGIYDYLFAGDMTSLVRVMADRQQLRKLDSVDSGVMEAGIETDGESSWQGSPQRRSGGGSIKTIDFIEQTGPNTDFLSDILNPLLIVAADVFVYVGNLEPVFSEVHRLTCPGDIMIFTVEAADAQAQVSDGDDVIDVKVRKEGRKLRGWSLQSSGRFSHTESYVRSLAQSFSPIFNVLSIERVVPRLENGEAINGYLVILEKAGVRCFA